MADKLYPGWHNKEHRKKLKEIQAHQKKNVSYSKWTLTDTLQWVISLVHDQFVSNKKDDQ